MGLTVKLGIDVLQEQNFSPLVGKRVGLYTNASGVDYKLRSTYDILWQADNVNLVALFAPEHGFAAAAQDGEHISDLVDSRTGVPMFSLYGGTYKPTEAMMNEVDVVVVDIQDIGVRYYTFMWTMTHVLEACAQYDVEMLILDRPNPLGAMRAGPVLDSSISTLVGRFPVPVAHGLTIGEIAQLVNGEWLEKSATVSVIACEYYQRSMFWKDTRLPYWIAPSPNMPRLETINHYIGSCLIEGTNLSEGRGTTHPFEIIGAPWINRHQLADELNRTILNQYSPYIVARPHSFQPTISKYAGEVCHGIQLHTSDKMPNPSLFAIWLDIVDTIRKLYPEEFDWIHPPQPDGIYHFDRLIGIPDFHQVDNFKEALNTESITRAMLEFPTLCKSYQLYDL